MTERVSRSLSDMVAMSETSCEVAFSAGFGERTPWFLRQRAGVRHEADVFLDALADGVEVAFGLFCGRGKLLGVFCSVSPAFLATAEKSSTD
jgi:hypothetical protein